MIDQTYLDEVFVCESVLGWTRVRAVLPGSVSRSDPHIRDGLTSTRMEAKFHFCVIRRAPTTQPV